MHHRKSSWTVVTILCSGLAITGCRDGRPPVATGTDRETRIVMNALAVLYGEYMNVHRGRAPKNSDAFRKFLASRTEELKQRKIDNLDQLLKSPRDGQPFIVVYGKRIAPTDTPGTVWAAYEQTGIDGIRMAVRVRGGVDLLQPEQFAKEFPAN